MLETSYVDENHHFLTYSVMSYEVYWYSFWYQWIKEIHTYTLVANIGVSGVPYRKSREGGCNNPPFGGRVTKVQVHLFIIISEKKHVISMRKTSGGRGLKRQKYKLCGNNLLQICVSFSDQELFPHLMWHVVPLKLTQLTCLNIAVLVNECAYSPEFPLQLWEKRVDHFTEVYFADVSFVDMHGLFAPKSVSPSNIRLQLPILINSLRQNRSDKL